MQLPSYEVGMIVEHPGFPEWGPGKVLTIHDGKLKIYFRDDGEKEFRTFVAKDGILVLAAQQADPILDNLPRLVGDRFEVSAKRVTFEAGLRRFTELFPKGFDDPKYIGDGGLGRDSFGERAYKWAAHERYITALGEGRGPRLLEEDQIEELVQRACSVATQGLNILSPFEAMALHDGLHGDRHAASGYFRALFAFVDFARADEKRFQNLADALRGLPVEKGKARVATWPVLTLFPFLADPARFICVKPEQVKECAERLRFDIQYASELRWITYRKILEMSAMLLERLRPLGARDYIDVQSFIYVIERY
jgi:hypothetical protein